MDKDFKAFLVDMGWGVITVVVALIIGWIPGLLIKSSCDIVFVNPIAEVFAMFYAVFIIMSSACTITLLARKLIEIKKGKPGDDKG